MKTVCLAKYGFNTSKRLKSGAWSFYAHTTCLYRAGAKDARQLLVRMLENLRMDGWEVEFSSAAVKPCPSFDRWSIIWCRVRARNSNLKVIK